MAKPRCYFLVVVGLLGYVLSAFAETETHFIVEIQNEINKYGHARVIVQLKGEWDESTAPKHPEGFKRRQEEVGKIVDRVLSRLTAEDFQLHHRYKSLPFIAGTVSQSGLKKLLADKDVEGMSLDIAVPLPDCDKGPC